MSRQYDVKESLSLMQAKLQLTCQDENTCAYGMTFESGFLSRSKAESDFLIKLAW